MILFFKLMMMLFICFCCFGVVYTLSVMIFPYIAAPTYAGMLFIEYFYFDLPEFMKFKQPKNGLKKYFMDLVASVSSLIGVFYIAELNSFKGAETEFFSFIFFRLSIVFVSLDCFLWLYYAFIFHKQSM